METVRVADLDDETYEALKFSPISRAIREPRPIPTEQAPCEEVTYKSI